MALRTMSRPLKISVFSVLIFKLFANPVLT